MAQDKMKRYIDCHIPVTACNFRCKYCYITVAGESFAGEYPKFEYTPEYMAQALSLKRLGGVCMINLCGGGETLLPPEIIDIIKALLAEGHYVMVVTNGVLTQKFQELENLPEEYRHRLMIKFSFHYLELKEKNLLDTYFDNIKRMENVGISYTLELVPHDEIIPLIPEIQEICMERVGALCHVTVPRDSSVPAMPILTKLSKEEFENVWSVFNSKLFDYKLSIFDVKRTEFCYGGEWTFFMHLGTGILRQCYSGQKIVNLYEDIKAPIPFCAVGNNCRDAHCYNCHSFIAFGTMPEVYSPYYLEMRDRKTLSGNYWIGEKMRGIFSSRCSESNKKYTMIEKLIVNYRNENGLVDQQIPATLKDVIKSKIKKMIGK